MSGHGVKNPMTFHAADAQGTATALPERQLGYAHDLPREQEATLLRSKSVRLPSVSTQRQLALRRRNE